LINIKGQQFGVQISLKSNCTMPRVGPTKYSDMTRDTVIMMSTEETTHKGMKPKGQAIST